MNLLATSDIHGTHLQRLAQLGQRDRETSIAIDNGDLWIGSAYATYLNCENKKLLKDYVKAAKFDVLVPGNHDLDYGLDHYRDLIADLDAKVLCCNLFDMNDRHLFEPHNIIERSGVRYGIIGAMTSNLFQLSRYDNVKDIKTGSAPEWIKKSVALLRNEVDVLIVSYHGGVERNLTTGQWTQYDTKEDEAWAIANDIAGIDILVCGHQHRMNEGRVKDTLLVQVPSHFDKVAKINLSAMTNQWLGIKAADEVDPEFATWLDTVVDFSTYPDFVSQSMPADVIYVEQGKISRRQFKESLSPLKTYHYSHEEVSRFDWFKSDNNKDSYTITTHEELDQYRMVKYSIENMFDVYMRFLSKQ